MDITERAEREDAFRFQAEHDPLTGLNNRTVFMKHLDNYLKQFSLQKCMMAVMFIDLDEFKRVNDTYGHGVGDKLLKLVSARLLSNLRESDVVSRLGGDEFAILLPFIKSRKSVNQIVKKILVEIHLPYQIGNHSIVISTSLGISFFPDDGGEAEGLIKKADLALYQAKSHGKNQYFYYRKGMGK